MSLEPAAAALAGIIVLQEFLSPVEWLAVACVIVASVGATRGSHRDRRAGPGLNPFPAEFTQTSHSVDQPDAPGS